MTISESKKALRKGILAKRRNLSEAYQKQAAQEIYEKLRALEVYKEASVLCLYVPIQKEVDLFQYIPESSGWKANLSAACQREYHGFLRI